MASNPEQDFVLKTIKSRDVHFVRFWFTDVLGSMAGTGWLIGHIAGITVDGVKLEGDWLRNDGAVPVKSALYPEGEKYEFIVDHEGAYERGVWYVYPVVENANHSTLLGSKTESYIDLYMNQIDIVSAK